jgi:hypothetical protein
VIHEPELLRATAALGDKLAKTDPWTAFFSEACRQAVKGKPADEALTTLQQMIDEAQFAKLRGEGPPLHEITIARRLFNEIHETWMAERLPSTARKSAA